TSTMTEASAHTITSERCSAIKTGTVATDTVAIITMVNRTDCCAVWCARAIRDDISTTDHHGMDRDVANTDGDASEQLTQHGPLLHHGYRLCVPLALVVDPAE